MQHPSSASERTMMSDLREWGGPIRSELQELLTDPLLALADRIDSFADSNPDRIQEISQMHAIDRVPYDVHDLPPNLFEHCGNPEPFIPSTENELERFMDAYWKDNLKLHASIPGFHMHATNPSTRQNITDNLRRRRLDGEAINPDSWAQYQESFARQKDRGFYTLGHNAAVMNMSAIADFAAIRGVFDNALGKQDSYLLSSINSRHPIGFYLRAPENAYGAAFTERLIRTANFMCDFIEQDRELAEDLWHQASKHHDVVANHTPRGSANRSRDGGIIYGDEESTIVVAQEGIISILGALNLLTAEPVTPSKVTPEALRRIEEYRENPDSLITQLVADDMLNKLTLQLPQAVAGASATYGIFIPDLLQDDGKTLSFRVDMRSRLQEMRERTTEIMHREWLEYLGNVSLHGNVEANEIAPKIRTGLPCPAAGSYKRPDNSVVDGAITRLSQSFLRVYNCIQPADADVKPTTHPWDIPQIVEGQR